MASKKLFFNYFKHVPDDLVINSTPGMIISAMGTFVLCTLFLFEFRAYMAINTETTLVVDELVDEVLRVNFNVTLHEVPCEYLTVDVSDLTGYNTHNISKDILKWRIDQNQRHLSGSMAVAAVEHKEVVQQAKEAIEEAGEVSIGEVWDKEAEPTDTKLSEHLSADTFEDFLKQHELTLVNYYAPWCIWCRRLEPVYLEAAAKIPSLNFHGHARLSQVDCVANQNFCAKNLIKAYPTLRMYKDGDPVNFELFTGSRTKEALLEFIQQQMSTYRKSHHVARKHSAARFDVKRGALIDGNDLYRAKLSVHEASEYCGNNPDCSGFTWTGPKAEEAKGAEEPMMFFKGSFGNPKDVSGHVNTDQAWTSYIKQSNATAAISTAGSLHHGPEGCQIAGHLQVRKVPGTLRFVLHSPEHDHEHEHINSTHLVNEFWFGDPLTEWQASRLSGSDREELDSPTSHLLERLPFSSKQSGHSHIHYLKVVTRVLKHVRSRVDTIVYKYTVHSNKFSQTEGQPSSLDFKYDLSPISIVVQQSRMPAYRFVTSTCAIIGGVFTMIGLFENIIHHASERMLKKQI